MKKSPSKRTVKEKTVNTKRQLPSHDSDYDDCDIWELYTDMFQIHWINGEAIEVEIYGKIFKSTK